MFRCVHILEGIAFRDLLGGFLDARIRRQVDEAMIPGLQRCINETKSVVDDMSDSILAHHADYLDAELRKTVPAIVNEHFDAVRSRCDSLMMTVADAVNSTNVSLSKNFDVMSKEILAQVQSQMEDRFDAQDDLFKEAERRTEKLGIELEGRIDRRLDKKILSAVEKKLKTFESELELGKKPLKIL
jgi:hypothetical protein